MPAPSFRVSMNIQTSSYGTQLQAFKLQQQKLAAANPTSVPRQFSLNQSIIGRVHNVRPGCGSCGK